MHGGVKIPSTIIILQLIFVNNSLIGYYTSLINCRLESAIPAKFPALIINNV
jgi:hypothetical protein